MTESKKTIRVEFAPGCFDQFDGSQDELDALQQEIQTMFATMTPEELAATSQPLDQDTFEDLDEDGLQQIISALNDLDNEERSRRLN